MINFIKKHQESILISSILSYTLLSYILLFRDKATDGIAHFYPATEQFLFSSRTFLLSHYLNTIPTILFALITIFAFLSYCYSLKTKLPIKKVVLIAVILQLISFIAFPIIESDIFSYMSSDRVNTVYHQNVWKIAPASLPFDHFSELADWKEFTRVYGGVNQLIYNIAAKAGNSDLILTIISYKLVVFVFTLLSIYTVYKIANIFFKGEESNFIKFIFWNPLFLLNIVGAGHNDIIMLFFMLGSYYFYLRKKQMLSGAFLALAIQTKLVASFLFPFLFLDLIIKRDFRNAFIFAISSTGISLALFLFMGIGPIEFVLRVLENSNIYWQGLPSLVFNLTGSKTPIFLFGFTALNLLLFINQVKTKKDPMYFYIISMTSYLIFFTSAYWNWYILWSFVFVPFIKNKALQIGLLIFTLTSTLAYALYWASLRLNYQNTIWPLVTYSFIFGIPLVIYFYYQYIAQFNRK